MANEAESEKFNAAYDKEDRIQYKKIIDDILQRQSTEMRTKAYRFYMVSILQIQ